MEIEGGERVEAPILLNAAGPWSSMVNKMAGAAADLTIEIAPMRQEVHHVPAPALLREPGAAFPAIGDIDLGIYLRPEPGGNMLVGGTEPECDPLEWVDDPDTVDVHASMELFEAQVTRAARRFPDLAVPNRPKGIAKGDHPAGHFLTRRPSVMAPDLWGGNPIRCRAGAAAVPGSAPYGRRTHGAERFPERPAGGSRAPCDRLAPG